MGVDELGLGLWWGEEGMMMSEKLLFGFDTRVIWGWLSVLSGPVKECNVIGISRWFRYGCVGIVFGHVFPKCHERLVLIRCENF
jgi:hypothetical protein